MCTRNQDPSAAQHCRMQRLKSPCSGRLYLRRRCRPIREGKSANAAPAPSSLHLTLSRTGLLCPQWRKIGVRHGLFGCQSLLHSPSNAQHTQPP